MSDRELLRDLIDACLETPVDPETRSELEKVRRIMDLEDKRQSAALQGQQALEAGDIQAAASWAQSAFSYHRELDRIKPSVTDSPPPDPSLVATCRKLVMFGVANDRI